ncbi:Trm112 family protein [Beijerinckia sp. L45]|uniref:Trm112 family protein n=1 Tax=Beijerinckia sp. L45 TaxID=1641855 RepID=UPI00131B3C21|nr:Trm112 family protein [Beijerinckia sp. L45]
MSDHGEASLVPVPGDSIAEVSRIDPRLLEILVCPLTKTTLEYNAATQELVSRAARLAYPIRDGIPIMLPEEARPLDEDVRLG